MTVAPLFLFGDRVLFGRSLAVGDGIFYDLPLHAVVARAIRSGHFPWWNPFEFAGEPLMANGQVGVFYPPNLAFVFMSISSAYDAVTLLSFVIAGIGTFLLARRLSGDVAGALIAGLSFSLSGFMVGQIVHPNLIASIAWLPWALFAFELTRDRFTIPRLALGGVAVALALLAGHAQMFLLILAVVATYGAAQAWFDRSVRPARTLGIATLIVLIGIGLSAVQLLPIVAIHKETGRTVLDYPSAISYSYSWSHLPLLLFPYLFGNQQPTAPFTTGYKGAWFLSELSAYPGLAASVLACAGLGSLRRDKRTAALVVAAVGCFLVALGGSTPLSHLVYRLPVANEFRAWGRYMVVVDLAIAVLAAKGVSTLRGEDAVARRAALWRAASFLMAVLVVAVLVRHLGAVQRFAAGGRPGELALLFPIGAAVAGLGVAILLARGVRGSAILTVIVVGIDMIGTFGAYAEWHQESLPRSFIDSQYTTDATTSFGPLAHPPGGIDRVLYTGFTQLPTADSPDATDAKGIRSTNGYDPLAPADYLKATGDMQFIGVVTQPSLLWPPRSHLLDLLRVTTILQGPYTSDVTPPDPAIANTAATPPDHSVVRYYYSPRLPDAFVVGAVRVESRSAILNAAWGNHPFDPASTALIEQPCLRCTADRPALLGRARVTWSQNGADVRVSTKRAGMLVLSQAWFPGWHAQVDGISAPVVRVDGIVQGVPIPAGLHEVVFSYHPPGLVLGTLVTLGSGFALVAAGIVRRRRQRRGPSDTGAPVAQDPDFPANPAAAPTSDLGNGVARVSADHHPSGPMHTS